jgi:hypothetical protein
MQVGVDHRPDLGFVAGGGVLGPERGGGFLSDATKESLVASVVTAYFSTVAKAFGPSPRKIVMCVRSGLGS